MTTTQGIKLESDIRDRLKALGAARGRSPHWLMKTAIQEYLVREEAFEQEKQEDMARWDHYRLTGHAVSHETASAWLLSLSEGKKLPCPDK